MRHPLLVSLPVAAAVLLACGPSPGEEPSTAPVPAQLQEELSAHNTYLLNGRTLNGPGLSGLLVGTSYDGAVLGGGQPLDRVKLAGTRFLGTSGGVKYQGSDFLGAEFVGTLDDGSPVRLKLAGLGAGTGSNADLSLYDVRYFDTVANAWLPACQDASGDAVNAIPVQGTWNYEVGVKDGGKFNKDDQSFTFACVSGAIGKCVLLGYRPWDKYAGKELAPYHQACTRMVRADYCGDGTSYTRNGYPIDVFDKLGLQQATEYWSLEAKWNPDRAACFRAHHRSTRNVPCYDPKFEQLCDPADPLKGAGLLISGIQ